MPWTERRERCCGVSRAAGQCSRLPRSCTAPCSGVPATPGMPVARLDSTRVSPTTSFTPSVFHERMIRAVHEVHDICWRLEGYPLHAPHGEPCGVDGAVARDAKQQRVQ